MPQSGFRSIDSSKSPNLRSVSKMPPLPLPGGSCSPVIVPSSTCQLPPLPWPMRIGHGTGGNWQVEDGTITGEQDPPGSGNGGILLTDRKFGDFELSIDLKPDWGICYGLFVRANDRGQGLQMMVDYHDAGN